VKQESRLVRRGTLSTGHLTTYVHKKYRKHESRKKLAPPPRANIILTTYVCKSKTYDSGNHRCKPLYHIVRQIVTNYLIVIVLYDILDTFSHRPFSNSYRNIHLHLGGQNGAVGSCSCPWLVRVPVPPKNKPHPESY
jgi:hypothetical protein